MQQISSYQSYIKELDNKLEQQFIHKKFDRYKSEQDRKHATDKNISAMETNNFNQESSKKNDNMIANVYNDQIRKLNRRQKENIESLNENDIKFMRYRKGYSKIQNMNQKVLKKHLNHKLNMKIQSEQDVDSSNQNYKDQLKQQLTC